jgi:hypothetical protein
MNKVNLGKEILRITHRWYFILLFILVGALVGWGCSFIWPASHQASLDLYVGLNAYRSPFDSYAVEVAGQAFRLVDDYKNWQMEQLDELVRSDSFIEEVLSRLGAEGLKWEGSPQDFRENSELLWRNPGEWKLVVDAKNSETASAAVVIWGNVILENVNEAIDHAGEVVALDIQMTSISKDKVELEQRQQNLLYVETEFSGWFDNISKMDDNQTIPTLDHWNMLSLVSQVVDKNPVWTRIMDDAPAAGSEAGLYAEWLSAIQSMITEELEIIPDQIEYLDESYSSISTKYKEETSKSFGLASTLVVERVADEETQVEIIRESADLALAGGVIGFLIWGIWEFSRISKRLDQN